MARTPYGFAFLEVISNGLYQPLAYAVGPQAASAVWATPGMIAGEDFTKAYIEDWKKRLVALATYVRSGGNPYATAAAYYGTPAIAAVAQAIANQDPEQGALVATKQFVADYKSALPLVESALGPLASTTETSPFALRGMLIKGGLDPDTLAEKLRPAIPAIRPDQIAFALNALLHTEVYDPTTGWGPDGKPTVTLSSNLGLTPPGAVPDPGPPNASTSQVKTTHRTVPTAIANAPNVATTRSGLFVTLEKRSLISYAAVLAVLTSPLWAAPAWERAKRLKRSLRA
jgi:hypothetical protein